MQRIIDISKYKRKSKIGEGSFAKVYIVEEKETNKTCVAKILHANIDDIPRDEMISLSNEVNIMSKLNHPSIIKFIGFSPIDFKDNNKPVIFIERALNGSLTQILQLVRDNHSKKSWDDTKKLINIYGIASGMMYLHAHDIIHRDLKPDNILMDENLNPKISDFGLSKVNHTKSSTLKSIAGIKGTPIYIAPEIWDNQQYGKAGDVYSFSLIVYEIVTNEIPFKNIVSISQIYSQIISGGYRPEFSFPIPDSYRSLIQKCWSNDPNDRPSFEKIVEDLKNDSGFITDTVDKEEFLNYVDNADEYKTSFNDDVQVIKLTKDPESQERSLHIITEKEKIIETEDDEVDINQIIKDANGDANKEFIVAKSYIEGINGFPVDSMLGINFLKKSSKGGCVESMIYYCRILIEGEIVPKNNTKAKKYLSKILHLKDPAIYELYNKIQKEDDDQSETKEKYQTEFELGKYYYEKAIQYLMDSKKKGCKESSEFLSKHIKDFDETTIKQQTLEDENIINEINNQYEKEKVDDTDHTYQEELRSLLIQNPPIEGRQRAVLVSTGSFCPIHKGHLKLFDTAAKFLSEEHNIDSILGIISPTSDIYVSPKFGSSAISFEHRYKMTKLACLEHNKNDSNMLKIIPDSWEGTRLDFLDFPIIYNHFKKEIHHMFPDENLLVLYVCGGDLFIKRKCFKRKGYVGISRPYFQIDCSTDVKKHLYVCNEKKYAGAYSDASFAINLAKENGESIEGLTYDSVAKYLHEVVHWI